MSSQPQSQSQQESQPPLPSFPSNIIIQKRKREDLSTNSFGTNLQWTLSEIRTCSTAMPNTNPSSDETETYTDMMRGASNYYLFRKKYKYRRALKSPNIDQIAQFHCCGVNCPRRWSIRRMDGKLALYTTGIHVHTKENMSHGIHINLKKMILQYLNSSEPPSALAYSELSRLDQEIQLEITGRAAVNEKLREKMKRAQRNLKKIERCLLKFIR